MDPKTVPAPAAWYELSCWVGVEEEDSSPDKSDIAAALHSVGFKVVDAIELKKAR